MPIEKILVVDDELLMRNFLAETLRRKQYEVFIADGVQTALTHLKHTTFDLVISDMKMPDGSGIDIIKKIKQESPSTIVMIMTAYGSIDNAVEAMRLGAFHYLIKPFTPDTIEALLEKAQEQIHLVQENQYLRQEVISKGSRSVQQIIGESEIMKKILADVVRIAKSQASVFINGESGTGKEVISHMIHHYSARANKPYIRVNCAALPDTLIESEFFGHEKGAFTGAATKRLGRFELAHTGTLLLDEVTEIPTMLQAKLLRVIQEQEVERLGGSKPIKVDVRFVSTSNRDMKEAISQKVFREDLYYRLNVVPIHLPALRDRKDDIIPLATYFLQRLCLDNHKKKKSFSKLALQKLVEYSWPGNIRELANVIERAVVMDFSPIIEEEHFYLDTISNVQSKIEQPSFKTLQELERECLIETLERQNYHRLRVAEELGISMKQLKDKIQYHELSHIFGELHDI